MDEMPQARDGAVTYSSCNCHKTLLFGLHIRGIESERFAPDVRAERSYRRRNETNELTGA